MSRHFCKHPFVDLDLPDEPSRVQSILKLAGLECVIGLAVGFLELRYKLPSRPQAVFDRLKKRNPHFIG